MPKTKPRRAVTPMTTTGPQPTICDKADVLFRSAAECCRQHRRYARLIEMETDESEQIAALRLVAASDEQLAQSAAVQIPLHAGVPGPKNLPAIGSFKPMTLDYAKAASRVDDVTKRLASILGL